MSDLLSRDVLSANAIVHDVLPIAHQPDHTFELPTGLYVASAGCFLAFLAILAAGMSSPGLIVPMAIFVVFIGMFFAIPALFTRVKPKASDKPMSWGAFKRRGIMTHTGLLSPKDAAIQMMILPVLIVAWGLICITIAAVVA
ncbi:hypothetical protein ACFCW2_00920 [Qipengyuania sp. DSG2-2]|uniref:hypothetical protein n=1 Tax=Qipengyuania sp. DGS2-2 TaxID=3349631 RepID=UPI0036D30178